MRQDRETFDLFGEPAPSEMTAFATALDRALDADR